MDARRMRDGRGTGSRRTPDTDAVYGRRTDTKWIRDGRGHEMLARRARDRCETVMIWIQGPFYYQREYLEENVDPR